MKICTKCHIEKEESEFFKWAVRKDGLKTQCKDCQIEYSRKWKRENRERNNRSSNKSYHKRKKTEKYISTAKRWLERNREKSNEIKKNWETRNKDKVRATTAIRNKQPEVKARKTEWMKKAREELKDTYIRNELRRSGYSSAEIKELPGLLDLKRLDILIRRSKKLLKTIKNKNHESKKQKLN